jgi:hypothetical protein
MKKARPTADGYIQPKGPPGNAVMMGSPVMHKLEMLMSMETHGSLPNTVPSTHR